MIVLLPFLHSYTAQYGHNLIYLYSYIFNKIVHSHIHTLVILTMNRGEAKQNRNYMLYETLST